MRIYIAEDEPLAAAKLSLFLEKLGHKDDVSTYADGQQLLTALDDPSLEPPEVLFLDIQMPHLDGLSVLPRIADTQTAIIITTAYDQYALKGFDYGVADYLLKPYTLARLEQALQKAQQQRAGRMVASQPEPDVVTLRCEGRNERIAPASILWVEALKDYSTLHLDDGRTLTTLNTLSAVEAALHQTNIVRLHRSYLVNTIHIRDFSAQAIHLTDGTELPVGRAFRGILKLLQ